MPAALRYLLFLGPLRILMKRYCCNCRLNISQVVALCSTQLTGSIVPPFVAVSSFISVTTKNPLISFEWMAHLLSLYTVCSPVTLTALIALGYSWRAVLFRIFCPHLCWFRIFCPFLFPDFLSKTQFFVLLSSIYRRLRAKWSTIFCLFSPVRTLIKSTILDITHATSLQFTSSIAQSNRKAIIYMGTH